MTKIHKPVGLIRYESLAGMQGTKRTILNARVIAYATVLVIGISGLVWAVGRRQPIDATILRGHDQPYTMVTEGPGTGEVLNHYKLHLRNHQFETISLKYEVVIPPELSGKVNVVTPVNPVELKPGELQRMPFFVRFPAGLTKGMGKSVLKIRFSAEGIHPFLLEKDLTLVGPF